MSSIYTRKVEYYETDKMGIVHHANYLHWFEEARTFALAEMGLEYKSFEDMGIMMPVLAVDCKYKTGAKYGDRVLVDVNVEKFNGVKMKFSYKITDSETGVLRVTGSSEHCFVDNDFKPLSLKKSYPAIYNKVLECIDILTNN